MTLKAIFRWKNPDSTADLNLRQANLVSRGISWGGEIQPGVGLTINVTPAVAHSHDGMTVLENENTVLNVLAPPGGQINVVVLKAQYNPGGSPAQPTLNWHVYEESVYNARPDKDYLIVYGKVILSGGAVSVTLLDIDTTERDVVDPMGRDLIRGIVATPAALPLPPPNTNREGDGYYVVSENTFYFWDGLAWTAQTSGAFSTETTDFNRDVVKRERDRVIQGSGVLSGTGGDTGFARHPQVAFNPDPTQDSMMGFQSFEAVVNGHFVETHAQLVQLDPKADRYDLIFLEVWREEVADPDSVTYERNPDGSTTYTLKQASDQYEQMLYTSGLSGNNFSLKELGTDDHKFLVTKYRFGHITGCGQNALSAPSDAAVVALALNFDGNAFTAPTAIDPDSRTWYGTAPTAYDGVSWAIPISVVRRTTTEDFTTNSAIQVFRVSDWNRWVFPVYPIADVENAARENLETQNLQDAVAYKPPAVGKRMTYPNEKPSGFLTGMEYEIGPGVAPNTVQFYNEPFKVRVRGIEDWIDFSQILGFDTGLGVPPIVNYAREFVYLKMNITLFEDSVNKPNYWLSPKHRPLFPSRFGFVSPVQGQGYKRGYVQWELVVDRNNVSIAKSLDEDSAMVANGYQRGDASLSTILPGSNFEFKDGGLWSKPIAVMEDDRVHPLEAEWAIPICLIHRRNSGAWDFMSNMNGSGPTRPDDRQDPALIHPDDLVDLRHMVDVSEGDLEAMLEADIEKLMKGQLRTRMASAWSGQGVGDNVAGSRILQSDIIGTAPPAFNLPVPDGNRAIWSDAREFQVVARSWDLTLAAGGPSDLIEYTPGATPILILRAPVGAHLIRHTPTLIYTDNDGPIPPAGPSATFLAFRSEPCWSTRQYNHDGVSAPAEPFPSPAEGKMLVPVTQAEARLEVNPETYTVLNTDDYGRPIEIRYEMNNVPGTAVASWWVHYDRGLSIGAGYPYNVNYGLAEIPDEVHRLVKGPTTGSPEEVNLGTLATVIRKTGVAGTSIVITSAEVLAASGVSGATARIMGFDVFDITYSNGSPVIDPAVTTLNSGQTTLTISWAGPYNGDLEVVVYFETDVVDKWAEVGRGGKSVRGYFSWDEHTIDYGVGADAQAYSLGSKVWQNAEVGDTLRHMPLFWTSAAPGGPWALVPPFQSGFRAGYRYSNIVSLSPQSVIAPPVQQYVKCIVPVLEAPSNIAADYLEIDYTYTPYQGLSADGGAIAVPATALVTLKERLHGEVVVNSDFYATQSGATSFFGGVDAWSGWPTRIPDITLNAFSSRFSAYNCSALVAPPSSKSALTWGHLDRRNSNAAAVMRLPFPASQSMSFGTVVNNTHRNMDFELDPGRTGAAAGQWSFAPAYPDLLTGVVVRADQFVNSLSRLASRGFRSENRRSYMVTAASYQGGHNGENYSHAITSGRAAWVAGPSSPLEADCDLRPNRGEVVANVMTALANIYEDDLTNAGAGNGVQVTVPGYPNMLKVDVFPTSYPQKYLLGNPYSGFGIETFPGAISNSELLLCVCSGSLMAYYAARGPEYSAMSRIDLETSAVVTSRYLLSTKVVLGDDIIQSSKDRLITGLLAAAGFNSVPHPDLVRVPFGSGSGMGQDYGATNVASWTRLARSSGRTSLKGARIAYPDSWTPAVITELESFIQASQLFHSGYGRGLYFGTTNRNRYTMPVLVPGSGIPINYLARNEHIVLDDNAEQPEAFPVQPMESLFENSNRRWYQADHGGQMAYVFYGLMINPESNSHHGRVTMQISGGPTSATDSLLGQEARFPEIGTEQVDGTALDAFHPTHRPILKSK